MPTKCTFVVTAFHGGVRGDEATAYCISDDMAVVLRAVQRAVALGYQFHCTNHGVLVTCLEHERIYGKDEFISHDELPVAPAHPAVVFYRWKDRRLCPEWRMDVLERLKAEGFFVPASFRDIVRPDAQTQTS